jgi:GNAT superfamily N-acetyltransferase
MDIVYRNLTELELDTIAVDLIKQVYGPEYVVMLASDRNNKDQRFIGAWKGEELIGMAGYAVSPASTRFYELNWGMVLEQYRGRGIGEGMIKIRLSMSLEEAKASGWYIEGWLIVTKPSRLYLKYGKVLHNLPEGTALILIPN